jgi:hypothetical protein
MITKSPLVSVVALLSLAVSGCGPTQDPCAGQQDYWGCRQYVEQDRANRLNTFNTIYNASQPRYQAPRPTTTNCTADGFGGMNCTSY